MVYLNELVDPDDIAYVRLLIGDAATEPILSDFELDALVRRAGGSLLYAAADALDAIAASEALVSKKITTQDLSTDGPAVAAELRKQAAGLRARADQQSAKVNEEAWGLAIFDPNRRPAKPELTEWPHP